MNNVKCHDDENCLTTYTDMGDMHGLCSGHYQSKVYS